MNKRGQFFILAAVIISIVVVSIVITKNVVRVNQDPTKFYYLSAGFKDESGRVIDYGIFTEDDKLKDFVNLSLANTAQTDPNIEFFLIYGDESSITFENYATEDVSISVGENYTLIPGANKVLTSQISFGNAKIEVTVPNREVFEDWKTSELEGDAISIIIDSNEYYFDLTDSKQFYLISKKSIGGEQHVDIR